MNRMDLSLRTPEQMWERWKDKYPEALEETVRLSEKPSVFRSGATGISFRI